MYWLQRITHLLIAALLVALLGSRLVEATQVMPGDVDGDGQVTATDMALLVDEVCGGDPAASEHPPGADANQDGRVSAPDLTKTVLLWGRDLPTRTPTDTPTSTPTATATPTPTATATPTAVCAITDLGPLIMTSGTVNASVKVTGTLGDGACTRFFGLPTPIPRGADLYTVTSSSGCTLTITAAADDFVPYVAAIDYGTLGRFEGPPPLQVPVSSGLPYEVQITSSPAQAPAFGSYRLTITQSSCPIPTP